MSTQFSIKTFDELTSIDIYHILKARSQVFVVEQNCAYQDMDEVDFDCLHLVAHSNEALVGYCRILPPDINTMRSNLSVADGSVSGPIMPAIGRVLVLQQYRGQGLARQIMMQAIAYCHKKYGKKNPIIISAQTYLINFYQSLGFVPEGEYYQMDGIEHVKMILGVAKKVKVKKEPLGSSGVATTLNILLLILGIAFIAGLIYLMT
ncbi:GNAT family N-acetyltransferase [Psychrobacter sp. M13]|uniref:GNAT family N-acetyltransferase n=1 Tax=Psychrobacter sp. M13 TaxID=3067275 RepID=UPI00273BC2B1|nr:GNAT family N-acetyltransferase [Psychrobacter sp. M13]WLP93320.1 GNAT family N-acetyltransferase [Psychrobacter sp. M13]